MLAVIPALFKINLGTAGLLISGGYLGQFVGAIAFGFFAERYGRKPAFVGTLLVFGIFSALAALATTFNELLLWRVIRMDRPRSGSPRRRRAAERVVARTDARPGCHVLRERFSPSGLLAAPLVGTALSITLPHEFVWRGMLWLGALPVVAALIAWRMLPESPRWLASNGRFAEADGIVARIGRSVQVPKR